MGIYHPKDSKFWWGNVQVRHSRMHFKMDVPYQDSDQSREAANNCFESHKGRILGLSNSQGDRSHNYFGFKKNKTRLISWLRRKYKMSLDEFRELSRQQKLRCQICSRFVPLCVDHSHHTGKNRGLLCRKCNLGIGYFDDSPALLSNAIRYLGRHGQQIAA